MGQGLAQELAEEYGPNVTVTEVTPGSADDPLNRDPSTTQEPPATQAEGTPAAATEPAAGAESEIEGEIPAEGAPAATTEGEEELTEDDLAALGRLDAFLAERDERIRQEVREQELPRVQSGLDRQNAELRRQLDEVRQQQEETNRQIREQQIASLPPAEQERIREGWANEDAARANDAYADELISYHNALDIARLTLEYAEFGVTAEELAELAGSSDEVGTEQLELHCARKQIAWLQEHPGQTPPAVNGAARRVAAPATRETQPAPPQQRKPAPAGARAPSDTGGAAPPPPPAKQVEGKGVEAMAASVADRDSWESVSFGKSRAG